MSILLYLLGKPHQSSKTSGSCETKSSKKKLQRPRGISGGKKKSLKTDTRFYHVAQAQMSVAFLPNKEEPIVVIQEKTAQPHIGSLLKTQPSFSSDYSFSPSYTDASMAGCRRAKTPVHFIGQLESKSAPFDPAQILAQQYHDILPARTFTPIQELKHRQKSIRKINCHASLRDLVKEQSRPPSLASDCDTLVGFESPPSLAGSPTKERFPEITKLNLVDKQITRALTPSEQNALETVNTIHNEIGLGICMDLLTNELASTLLKQHATTLDDRAPGLQILLMIEAYENLQQHIRKELYETSIRGEEVDSHVKDIELILDQWLDSLYAVYDRAQQISPEFEAIQEAEEEEEECAYSRRNSEDSVRTFVTALG